MSLVDINEKINQIVSQLTIEQKAALCSGYDFWHTKAIEEYQIPSIMLSDGPHGLRVQRGKTDHLGVRKSEPATCFPTASAVANSFDKELLKEMGAAIGNEAKKLEVSVVLGPGINIKRNPLCGRNFEYYSEDPCVSGRLSSAFVTGVQSEGVGCCVKHFAANNQERARFVNNSIVDERTLREIYLSAFEEVVKKARPWSIMCSYNQINGTFVSENSYLLTDILRKEWGFEGVVVTDWGAVCNRVKGIKAGLDLEMPYLGPENDAEIVKAVHEGILSEDELDICVKRNLMLAFRAKEKNIEVVDVQQNHDLARRIEENSAVLLKNDNHTLPIYKNSKIAVIGAFAESPRYQGAGSSRINPVKIETPLEELKKAGCEVNYAEGYSLDGESVNREQLDEAIGLAEQCEYAVVFAGLPDRYESEGYDRDNLSMPESHNTLIKEVSRVNKNTVVVLMCGAPVEMVWKDDVAAILYMALGGEAIGGACANLLLGKANPSGKLAETWPKSLEDVSSQPYFSTDTFTTEYRESIFVGYRWYDLAEREVNYPFGYGLSYTDFKIENIELSAKAKKKNEMVQIQTTIRNTGVYAGAEVVQVYVRKKDSSILRPMKELKDFAKVFLNVGEEKTIIFTLDDKAFSYYDCMKKDWCIEDGKYEILIGNSSRGEFSVCSIEVEGEIPQNVAYPEAYKKFSSSGTLKISEDAFAELFYGTYKKYIHKVKPFHRSSTVGDLGKTFIGKKIQGLIIKAALPDDGAPGNDLNNMVEKGLYEYPLRAIAVTKALSLTQIDGLVNIVNGHIIKGIKQLKTKPE